MALTIPAARKFLYGLLAADPTIAAAVGTRIFPERVPAGQAYPAIVYSLLAAVPVIWMGPRPVYTHLECQILATDEGESLATVTPIANAVDQAMRGAHGTNSAGEVFATQQTSEIHYVDDSGGVAYQRLGAQYRLEAQAP